MSLMTKSQFQEYVNKGGEDQIYIDPILDDSQAGAVSFDLRLGGDFLVSVRLSLELSNHSNNPIELIVGSRVVQARFYMLEGKEAYLNGKVKTRRPSIKIIGDHKTTGSDMFFQESRRDLGDPFLIYPNQIVLATSLEYIGLPNNIYADVIGRSSYNRLGIGVGSMFQPGFRGCLSLELSNHSNNPIELIVGSRVVQARFYMLEGKEAYLNGKVRRKYIGNVRPVAPRASRDVDLIKISKMTK